MNDISKILLTLFFAVIGGISLYKLKVPSGAMIGAMTATLVFGLVTGIAYIPLPLRVFIQLFAGMRIGYSIKKKDVLDVKKLAAPAVILVIGMVLLNLCFGTLMNTVGDLDIATALFACSPGGMTDMAIIADEMGANPFYVIVLQLSRLLFIYLILPPVFRYRLKKGEKSPDTEERQKSEVKINNADTTSVFKKIRLFILTASVGISSGLLFRFFGIKAGALLGSMIGVALLNIFTGYTYFPKKLNLPIRFVSGAYIGQQITLESLIAMSTLGVHVLIMWLGVLAFSFVVPAVVKRFSKLDQQTCMLASVPGGTQEMSLLAEDLGADVPKVVLLQTVRQVAVFLIFPTMLTIITNIFK